MKLRCTQFWSGTLANSETRSFFYGNEIELDDDVARALLAEHGDRFEIVSLPSPEPTPAEPARVEDTEPDSLPTYVEQLAIGETHGDDQLVAVESPETSQPVTPRPKRKRG